MKKSTYPVLLPPLTRAQATEAIGNILINDLGNDAEVEGIFSELSGRIESDLGLRTQKSAWSEAVADFNEGFGAAQAKIASTAEAPSTTDLKTSSVIALDDDVRLINVSVVGRELRGEATNTIDGPFAMVIIGGTFYTDAGSIAGAVKDIVSNLKADQISERRSTSLCSVAEGARQTENRSRAITFNFNLQTYTGRQSAVPDGLRSQTEIAPPPSFDSTLLFRPFAALPKELRIGVRILRVLTAGRSLVFRKRQHRAPSVPVSTGPPQIPPPTRRPVYIQTSQRLHVPGKLVAATSGLKFE
ncbi:hypothetical protein BH93_02465 [Rhodococcoides fascians A25f]|uniref:hypothetical protein n=1 Tax=Rhodococcoides fascians TaxID=1828 RepID=UPI0012D359E6|nr:hypothetical protein [Rhodococcus fascians]QII04378.1 hypothetical protein BH93_02465 [Rhodococcus fascians A25f]